MANSSPVKSENGFDGSVEANGQKKESGPSDSWETAYVFAFLQKFCKPFLLSTPLLLQTAQDLEQALLLPSPKPPTTTLNTSTTSTTEWEPSLEPILNHLADLIKPKASKEIDKFLEEFADEVMTKRDVACRWVDEGKENVIRDAELEEGGDFGEKGFWALNWQDRAHLLRLMVDKILTDSPTVRDQINEHYNLGSQKTAKRTADKNPLVIEKLGNDKLKRHWWQLDDTPRLYAMTNPFKRQSTWTAVCTTKEELQVLASNLTPPVEDAHKDLKGPWKKAKSARKSAAPAEEDRWTKDERVLRQKIENDLLLRYVSEEYEAEFRKLETKRSSALRQKISRMRATERAAAMHAENVASRAAGGYGRRLRTIRRKPEYVYDEGAGDEAFEKTLKTFDAKAADDDEGGYNAGESGFVSGKRKRSGRSYGDDDSEGGDDGDDYEGSRDYDDDEEFEDDDLGENSKRRSSRNSRGSEAEWRGERRSSRIQTELIPPKESDRNRRSVSAGGLWSREAGQGGSTGGGAKDEEERPLDYVPEIWSKGKLVKVGSFVVDPTWQKQQEGAKSKGVKNNKAPSSSNANTTTNGQQSTSTPASTLPPTANGSLAAPTMTNGNGTANRTASVSPNSKGTVIVLNRNGVKPSPSSSAATSIPTLSSAQPGPANGNGVGSSTLPLPPPSSLGTENGSNPPPAEAPINLSQSSELSSLTPPPSSETTVAAPTSSTEGAMKTVLSSLPTENGGPQGLGPTVVDSAGSDEMDLDSNASN